MPTRFRAYQPDQILLMPPKVREWVAEGHLAHQVSDVVDSLDLSAFYAPYEGDGRRNAPYSPTMMVKVLIYGYATGVFSSRGIARKLEEDVAFRMLAAGNFPKHRSPLLPLAPHRHIPRNAPLLKGQQVRLAAVAGIRQHLLRRGAEARRHRVQQRKHLPLVARSRADGRRHHHRGVAARRPRRSLRRCSDCYGKGDRALELPDEFRLSGSVKSALRLPVRLAVAPSCRGFLGPPKIDPSPDVRPPVDHRPAAEAPSRRSSFEPDRIAQSRRCPRRRRARIRQFVPPIPLPVAVDPPPHPSASPAAQQPLDGPPPSAPSARERTIQVVAHRLPLAGRVRARASSPSIGGVSRSEPAGILPRGGPVGTSRSGATPGKWRWGDEMNDAGTRRSIRCLGKFRRRIGWGKIR